MARQWFDFFGLVLVVALAVDASANPTTPEATKEQNSVVTRCSVEIDRQKSDLRVGDAISYQLGGCSSGLEISPTSSLYEHGIAVRPGRVIVIVKDGDLSIPELDVIDTKTLAIVGKTDPFTFKSQSSISESADAKDENAMKPEPPIGYMSLGLPPWIQMAVALIILVVLAVLAFFILRWMKNKAKRIMKAVLPKKPYDVQALARLQKLLDLGHLRKGEWKPFAFGVSDTLKYYLGERYGFDAQESTTSELFQKLEELSAQGVGPNSNIVQNLRRIFDDLDIVKFTDHVPTVDSMLEVWKIGKKIIEQTRIQKVDPILKDGAVNNTGVKA